ncbi:TPA: bacteriocin immunity protein [Pseudomonas putida]|uniref:bacteriocin immunity protein n=1 Tax=Pseudomonas sp. TaxID=306 RepID=UPI0028B0459B|nr:bacteriocin immunity protein [Pseudomonas sp.]
MVISQKHSLADYTCAEFAAIVKELLHAAGSSAWQDRLLEHFIDMVGHPSGSDLIYYSTTDHEDCAKEVIARIIAWRKSQGLPLFKDG